LLTEEKETLEVRLKAVERQENHLKERFTSMQRELTEALQAAGLTAGPSNEPAEGASYIVRRTSRSPISPSSRRPSSVIPRVRATRRFARENRAAIRASE